MYLQVAAVNAAHMGGPAKQPAQKETPACMRARMAFQAVLQREIIANAAHNHEDARSARLSRMEEAGRVTNACKLWSPPPPPAPPAIPGLSAQQVCILYLNGGCGLMRAGAGTGKGKFCP